MIEIGLFCPGSNFVHLSTLLNPFIEAIIWGNENGNSISTNDCPVVVEFQMHCIDPKRGMNEPGSFHNIKWYSITAMWNELA